MKKLTCLLTACLIAFSRGLHAQPDNTLNLPLVEFSNQPAAGTYWMWSYRTGTNFGIPVPFNPFGSNVNVYAFTNEFLGDIRGGYSIHHR